MGLKVKLIRSLEGSNERQRETVYGLGLNKFGSERILQDTPDIRGMVFKVKHLVHSEVVSEEAPKRKRMKPRKVRVREAARQKKAEAQKQ